MTWISMRSAQGEALPLGRTLVALGSMCVLLVVPHASDSQTPTVENLLARYDRDIAGAVAELRTIDPRINLTEKFSSEAERWVSAVPSGEPQRARREMIAASVALELAHAAVLWRRGGLASPSLSMADEEAYERDNAKRMRLIIWASDYVRTLAARPDMALATTDWFLASISVLEDLPQAWPVLVGEPHVDNPFIGPIQSRVGTLGYLGTIPIATVAREPRFRLAALEAQSPSRDATDDSALMS